MKVWIHLWVVVALVFIAPAKADDMFVFFKAGAFTVDDTSFTSDSISSIGFPVSETVEIDAVSDQSFAIGMEWLLTDKWSIGFELYRTKHAWESQSGITGEIDTRIAVASAKYFFRPRSVIRPYMGGGFGRAHIDMGTGDSWDNQEGIVLHLGAGALFDFSVVSVFLESRYIEALNFGFSDFKYSGSGLYAGLRMEL